MFRVFPSFGSRDGFPVDNEEIGDEFRFHLPLPDLSMIQGMGRLFILFFSNETGTIYG